jgi:hypothetical protein
MIYEVKFTHAEVRALLRLIATANDAERTEKQDRTTGTWIAQRLLTILADTEEAAIRSITEAEDHRIAEVAKKKQQR